MDSYSASDLDLTADGSQLLDISDVMPSSSQAHSTSHEMREDANDLSISDLSLDQTIRAPAPFSLLSQPLYQPEPPWSRRPYQENTSRSRSADPEEEPYDFNASRDEEGGGGEEDAEGEEVEGYDNERQEVEIDSEEEEDRENARRRAVKAREEKLQGDIFILKKLNAAFETFNEALDDAGSANHRVAAQLLETDALLNKYVRILSKSEQFSRLVFDEQWQGAEADEEQIRLEQLAAEQKAREAIREKALAEQREHERLEKEERERGAREEKERLEREKKERLASRGGVRGVRGTRASMRGMRGASVPPRPESSTSARSRPSVAPGQSTGIPVKRGTSIGGTTGRGISRRA